MGSPAPTSSRRAIPPTPRACLVAACLCASAATLTAAGPRTGAGDPPAARRDDATSPGAVAPLVPATMLVEVTTAVAKGRIRITLRGNGWLEADGPRFTEDAGPGLSVDLPGVDFTVGRVIAVGTGDVRRIRIGLGSARPLVTRVVVELAHAAPCELSRNSNGEVVIVVGKEVVEARSSASSPPAALLLSRPLSGPALPPVIVPGIATSRVAGPPITTRQAPAPLPEPLLSRAVTGPGATPVAALNAAPFLPASLLAEAPPAAATPSRSSGTPVPAGRRPAAAEPIEAAATDNRTSDAAPAPLRWATQATTNPAAQGTSPAKRARGAGSARVHRSGGSDGPRLFKLRSFRTALGVGYDLVGTRVEDTAVYDYQDRMTSPLATIQVGASVIDPRILTLDGWVDLRLNWRQYDSDQLASHTRDTLQNYRVNFLVMSGRSAPLNLYLQRVDLALSQRQNAVPTATFLDLSQTGIQTTRGFSWDVAGGRRLPHIVATGDVTDRRDYGSFLAGWDSRSRQQRLEVRADQAFGATRYEGAYSHERSKYDYPLAQVSSDYAIDVLRGTATALVRPGLSVDAGGRLTRYSFGGVSLLARQRDLVSAGGFGGFSWTWSSHWRANARYNVTSNESDISLAASPPAGDAAAQADAGLTARRRFLYQDFDARVTHTAGTGGLVTSVFTRGLSLDPIEFVAPTLSALRLAGVQVDAGRSRGRLDFSAGAEGAIGTSVSNRGDTAPYREVGARGRIAGRLSRATLSGNGGVRWNDGTYFHPVAGHAWYGTVETALNLASELRMRASATRSFLLRDVVFQRGDDATSAVSAGVSGSRYDVALDYADTNSSAAGLLETTLMLEPRPDLALAARPELFGLLYASRQVLRSATVRFSLVRGLDIVGRGRLDRIRRPSSTTGFDLEQTVGQVGAVWGIRQMQAELGWEYIDYRTQLVSTTNRRFYVRVRRDVPLF